MKIRALVLAAGKGTRMKSELPKVLHSLSGRPLVQHILETLRGAGVSDIWVVAGHRKELLLRELEGQVRFVTQVPQLGTGHAVLCAEKSFVGFGGDVLVLAGDVPFIESATLKKLIRDHVRHRNACTCLSMTLEEPKGYGRILRGAKGEFRKIQEELEASPEERLVREVNTGVYVFNYPKLRQVLRRLKPSPKKKELYLTDALELLLNTGSRVEAYPYGSVGETQGVNTREELSRLEEKMNLSIISALQSQGVTVVMPSQTYIQKGVKVGEGTVIHPFVWMEKGVVVGKNCEIGPFAKLREGSRIEDGASIGSFVEIVRSRIGKKTRIKHLSYFGDAEVGAGVNVGAGTITANYDGKNKSKTRVGDGSFLGVHTSLVAPVVLEKGVKTGAGAVVTARQRIKKGSVVVGVPARELKRRGK